MPYVYCKLTRQRENFLNQFTHELHVLRNLTERRILEAAAWSLRPLQVALPWRSLTSLRVPRRISPSFRPRRPATRLLPWRKWQTTQPLRTNCEETKVNILMSWELKIEGGHLIFVRQFVHLLLETSKIFTLFHILHLKIPLGPFLHDTSHFTS